MQHVYSLSLCVFCAVRFAFNGPARQGVFIYSFKIGILFIAPSSILMHLAESGTKSE